METVPIKLTKRLVLEADQIIKEGWYANKSELIRDAIRDLIKKIKSQRLESAIRGDIEWGLYMENKLAAVSNTGPILHLFEIDFIKALNIFKIVYAPNEVRGELKKDKVDFDKISKIKVVGLSSKFKDTSKLFSEQYDLDLGESEAISSALQQNVNLFLTDDLDARNIANSYNLEVHGTIGIILRAYKEKMIDKRTAIAKLSELYEKSTLFITKDLVDMAVRSIENSRI